MVLLYLVAIVTANWSVATFGPGVAVVNAFVFIGFNLVARDHLHDAWRGRHLRRNMILLIAAGSLLSIPFNAGRIALASFVAFAASEAVDAITYHYLRRRRKLVRQNASNAPSALVDSILFPLLAFGWPPLLPIMAGQFVAKVMGGFVWSMLIAGVERLAVWLGRRRMEVTS